MTVSDAYLYDLQMEDQMYDDRDLTDEEWNAFYDDDADLEIYSLECAYGPNNYWMVDDLTTVHWPPPGGPPIATITESTKRHHEKATDPPSST